MSISVTKVFPHLAGDAPHLTASYDRSEVNASQVVALWHNFCPSSFCVSKTSLTGCIFHFSSAVFWSETPWLSIPVTRGSGRVWAPGHRMLIPDTDHSLHNGKQRVSKRRIILKAKTSSSGEILDLTHLHQEADQPSLGRAITVVWTTNLSQSGILEKASREHIG